MQKHFTPPPFIDDGYGEALNTVLQIITGCALTQFTLVFTHTYRQTISAQRGRIIIVIKDMEFFSQIQQVHSL